MANFTLCLWLVPFAFFVSLSANENILPTMAERKPLLSGNWYVLEFAATGQIFTIMSKRLELWWYILFYFSENENDVVSNYFMRKEKKIGLLSAFQSIKEQILPTRVKKSFWPAVRHIWLTIYHLLICCMYLKILWYSTVLIYIHQHYNINQLFTGYP